MIGTTTPVMEVPRRRRLKLKRVCLMKFFMIFFANSGTSSVEVDVEAMKERKRDRANRRSAMRQNGCVRLCTSHLDNEGRFDPLFRDEFKCCARVRRHGMRTYQMRLAICASLFQRLPEQIKLSQNWYQQIKTCLPYSDQAENSATATASQVGKTWTANHG
jgi:hypothetical protein